MSKNKKPARSENRTVGLRAVEQSEVEVIRDVESIAGVGEIEAATEDPLDEFFLPDYGGSE